MAYYVYSATTVAATKCVTLMGRVTAQRKKRYKPCQNMAFVVFIGSLQECQKSGTLFPPASSYLDCSCGGLSHRELKHDVLAGELLVHTSKRL